MKLRVDQARRIALAAQGFADARPTGVVTARHFRRAMDRMTILQLDSVIVVSRSHYLPMLARLGPYDRDKLDEFLYESGENWEFFSHEASITTQELYPLLQYRTGSNRWKKGPLFEAENSEYVQQVFDEVATGGPLSIKQLSDPGKRTGPWWGMPKGKVALEWLYISGRLCISKRDSMFVTHYDLPENVIRPEVLARPVAEQTEAMRELLLLGARSHGIGTAKDLADYFRLRIPDARPLLKDLVAEGKLELVEVEGWEEPTYLHPEAKRPRSINGRALLSPFDPVVWFRPRGERLFNFAYKIEIYVPEPKRIYGYYVLPFLLGDQIVGRVDLKADRKAGLLLARQVHAEEDLVDRGVSEHEVAAAMADALGEMAAWLGLDGVQVGDRGNLASALAAALAD